MRVRNMHAAHKGRRYTPIVKALILYVNQIDR